MLKPNPMKAAGKNGKESDGRRLRSEASRERIVKSMLELVSAGDVSPSAESVARRAGVGLRTVFRHFDNMESLYREIDSLITAEVLTFVERPFQSGTWQDKLQEIVERRVRIFERILPIKTAADVHRHSSPFLERRMNFFARAQRDVILGILPAGYAQKADFVESLDLVLSLDTWRRLRKEQKLSAPRARRVLDYLISILVGAET